MCDVPVDEALAVADAVTPRLLSQFRTGSAASAPSHIVVSWSTSAVAGQAQPPGQHGLDHLGTSRPSGTARSRGPAARSARPSALEQRQPVDDQIGVVGDELVAAFAQRPVTGGGDEQRRRPCADRGPPRRTPRRSPHAPARPAPGRRAASAASAAAATSSATASTAATQQLVEVGEALVEVARRETRAGADRAHARPASPSACRQSRAASTSAAPALGVRGRRRRRRGTRGSDDHRALTASH